MKTDLKLISIDSENNQIKVLRKDEIENVIAGVDCSASVGYSQRTGVNASITVSGHVG
jgi:hypothetical protein